MGFAAVTTVAGTNWKEYLSKKRYDRNTLTLKEKVDAQDAEVKQLTAELQEATDALKLARETRQADMAAMNQREEALIALIEDVNQQIIDVTKEVTVTGNKVIDVKNETNDRFAEVVRLRHQLEELRAQIAVADEEEKRLADRVVQAEELLKLAQRRNERLKNQ